MKTLCALLAASLLLPVPVLHAQGNVYLVLGSDTAIWDGMDVSRYNCTYTLSLFTDPARNATRVMDPAFRLPLTDSYGTPVKLTWWMMAGNIFRHATNTNIPNPNTMTLYLMKKNQGELLRSWGDELTLHYHTFVWTDYNGDGTYYWNQALSFPESSEDFDVTLAEMLLEEETFPVSFRSGWHAMDNAWQQRLDELLPYSLHNDWPARRTDTTEPLDNTFDWSRAPSSFVPFQPSPTDYQVPGSGKGWNVRSAYMSSVDSTFMAGIFAKAATGIDQLVCLWAHLPETDFLDNVRKVDASAHKALQRFPGMTFRYCTAVEAMQRWRQTGDTVRPHLTFEEISEGAMVRWAITSDEPLFQPAPFVAVKDRYGEFRVIPSQAVGDRSWETSVAVPRADIAKSGVAATDTAGNLTTALIRYLPDDIIVDNTDPGYVERAGIWTTSLNASWGTSARQATLGISDSARAEWMAPIQVSSLYNVTVRVPSLPNPAQHVEFQVWAGLTKVTSRQFTTGVPGDRWIYLGTPSIPSGADLTVVMVAGGAAQPGTQVAADAVKVSALVRDQWLVFPDLFDAGEMIVQEEHTATVLLHNEGVQHVVLSAVTSLAGTVTLNTPLPVTVPSMGETQLALTILPSAVGPFADTLVVHSDDPRHSEVLIPVRGNVQEYFAIVDDIDAPSYAETGAWYFSVAQAYGGTSRYAYPAPGVSATFKAQLKKAGIYRIQAIVPTTVNASVRARYMLSVDTFPVDSAFIDQNAGSGAWNTLIEHDVPGGSEARVDITDAMSPVVPGKVLRADAMRFQWIRDGTTAVKGDDGIPGEYSLQQNYPNPFNPATTIGFDVAGEDHESGVSGQVSGVVRLIVYDVLGREVAVLVNQRKAPGSYRVKFNASGMASGVYLYRLTAGDFVQTRRMLLLQ